ncbi:MAG: hypothetical protein U0169_02505 [Polyangiaceae bacterium]
MATARWAFTCALGLASIFTSGRDAAAADTTATSAEAAPTKWVAYLHGRGEDGWGGEFRAPAGWGTVDIRYNATTATLAEANVGVTKALRDVCTNGNQCVIVAYSNGTMQAGRSLDIAPDLADGVLYVESGGAAIGGSELVSLCGVGTVLGAVSGWDICYPNGVDATLSVSGARAAFDHNSVVPWYHVGGNTNWLNRMWYVTAAILPGDDDGVVAFHSAFGCRASGSQTTSCSKFGGHFLDTWCSPCPGGVCRGEDHWATRGYAVQCF